MSRKEEILKLLSEVYDPEIPVLNIVEMGIVHDVVNVNEQLVVTITPTYFGCPAMKQIEDEINNVLKKNGINEVAIKKVFSPAWSTDCMTDESKKKLKEYGIAPPERVSENILSATETLISAQCPMCESRNTKMTSYFGSTSCKSLHFCLNCSQLFESFKCI